MTQATSFTGSQLVAAARTILIDGGYSEVAAPTSWTGSNRLFEDDYGIVAIHVYDTWLQLEDQWATAQGLLVDLLSAKLRRSEPKAWEGYLVLLTGSPVTPDEAVGVSELRYNTNRVRKLVATGEDLQTLNDVRTALLPSLPLEMDAPPQPSRGGLLDRLPQLLADQPIRPEVIRTVIDAFIANESIADRLHQQRRKQ